MDFHLSENSVVVIILFFLTYLFALGGVAVKIMMEQSNHKKDIKDLKDDRIEINKSLGDLVKELSHMREAFVEVVHELRDVKRQVEDQ